MAAVEHICSMGIPTCKCTSIETNRFCPIHGINRAQPKCAICGRMMKWDSKYEQTGLPNDVGETT